MRKTCFFFSLILVGVNVFGPAYAQDKKKSSITIPEIREPLDTRRAELLMILATDAMMVRHYSADRLVKLKELEINVSLQPFNEKQKALLAQRKKEMEECAKEAGAIQTNFFNAYQQLDEAKYDVADYRPLVEYAKKNVLKFQKKDTMYPEELQAYIDRRPKGFVFRSTCIAEGSATKVKEKVDFVSPTTVMKK